MGFLWRKMFTNSRPAFLPPTQPNPYWTAHPALSFSEGTGEGEGEAAGDGEGAGEERGLCPTVYGDN